ESNLNFGVHREAVLSAFDPRNLKILRPQDGKTHLRGDVAELTKEIRNLQTGVRKSPNEPSLGLEHVVKLQKESPHAALTYLYQQTRLDPHMLPPTDRAAWIRWLAGDSPLMVRMLEQAVECVRDQNERLLIYVDTPWIQSVVVSLLKIASFNVSTVRSSDSAAARLATIDSWNNPDSKDQIFVANVNTMATGVNLHTCCANGIFLNWHLNCKVMSQIIGRLVRIGQKKQVHFHLLKVKNTYHDNIERLCLTKWMVHLSAEIALPEWLKHELVEICICEAIKSAWNTPFNRYAWISQREMENKTIAYHSEDMVKLGHILSIVAKLLLNAREDEQSFWIENIDFVMEACCRLSKKMDSADHAESLLLRSIDDLRQIFLPELSATIKDLQGEADKADGVIQSRRARLRQAVHHRQNDASAFKETGAGDGDDDSDSDEEANEEGEDDRQGEEDEPEQSGTDAEPREGEDEDSDVEMTDAPPAPAKKTGTKRSATTKPSNPAKKRKTDHNGN
ncbi:hypothetical protein QQZ08_012557, partial [Neonectria magnoliae]